MDVSTLVFLIGMSVVTAYISYLAFCDVYALVTNSIEDIASNSLLVKLHINI